MCFKNLPIEFDDSGKAGLKEGIGDPYSVTVAEPKGYVRRKEGPGASVPDDQIKGIDVLGAIRSFDPCMPCTTHMDTGKGIITREINSCGCTLE